MSKVKDLSNDEFFIYGRVNISEWNWKQEGSLIAKILRKKPQAYINFDSGKLMGMFHAIEEYEMIAQEAIDKGREIEQQRKQAINRAEKYMSDASTWKSLYEDRQAQFNRIATILKEISEEMDKGGCQYAIIDILKKFKREAGNE